MTVHYTDDWLTVLHGDVRDELRTLPDESVHCVVTSPPFWGLRDYGTATWDGGDPSCDHTAVRRPGEGDKSFKNGGTSRDKPRNDCRLCGAVRLDNQLGLEPTPEQYVENMVAVFREVRRVLRSDGTLWLNLGDTYAATRSYQVPDSKHKDVGNSRGMTVSRRRDNALIPRSDLRVDGLKPKDLVGIPWRVAFALQADGWYLRSDIIWSKPNPMPESVTDRPTKSHEYLFLLAKSARYYFDADAVREDPSETSLARIAQPNFANQTGGPKDYRNGTNPNRSARQTLENFAANPGRNIRSVWTIATASYPGAHFATFPPKLVEPCIKAGTSEKGVCPECGRPWRRVTERLTSIPARAGGPKTAGAAVHNDPKRPGGYYPDQPRTISWIPSCSHEADPVGAVVLDPFAGSGTTGMVAQSLSRCAILVDLNVDYLGQLMERNRDIPLGLEAS